MKKLNKMMVRAAAIFFFLNFSIPAGATTVRVGSGGTASKIGGMITVNTDADVGKITVGKDSTVRISSVNIRNSDLGGDFQVTRAESEIGTVTIRNGSHLNVTSVNIHNAATNGRVDLDMRANIGEIEIKKGSKVSIGSFDIGEHNPKAANSNQVVPINNEAALGNQLYISYLPPPPQYLPGMEIENGDLLNDISMAMLGLVRSDDEWKEYDKNYQLAMKYYYDAKSFKNLAEKAIREGNLAQAQKYVEKYRASLQKSNNAESAMRDQHDGSLAKAAGYAKKVYDTAKLSAELIAAYSGNSLIETMVTGLFLELDYQITKSEKGKTEAQKQLVADALTEIVCSAPVYKGKTLQDVFSSPYEKANKKILQNILNDKNAIQALSRPLERVLIKLEEEGTKALIGTNAKDSVKDVLRQILEKG